MLLSDLPHRWRDNKSIAVIAIAQRGVAIGSASQRLKENRALALLAAGHDDTGLVLGTMADHFRADKQIALAAVRGTGLAMVGIDEPLLHDKDIIAAASATFEIAQHLTPALRNDKDFILRIAKVCNPVVLGPALDAFVHDEAFLQELLQITSRDRIALLRVTNLAGKSVMTSIGLYGVNVNNYDGMVTYLGLDRLFAEDQPMPAQPLLPARRPRADSIADPGVAVEAPADVVPVAPPAEVPVQAVTCARC